MVYACNVVSKIIVTNYLGLLGLDKPKCGNFIGTRQVYGMIVLYSYSTFNFLDLSKWYCKSKLIPLLTCTLNFSLEISNVKRLIKTN